MALNKQVMDLLRDSTISDDAKVWALTHSSKFHYDEARARQLVWGARNEARYEKWFRQPARIGVSDLLAQGPLALATGPLDIIRYLQGKPQVGTAGPAGPFAKKAAEKIVPRDLNAAVQILALIVSRGRGGRMGQAGVGLAGGMAGGYLQGQDLLESAREAAPGATMAGAVEPGAPLPSFAERTDLYKRGVSNQAAHEMAQSSGRLYTRLMTENPDLKMPSTLEELIDFFSPTGKARARAGQALQNLRQSLSKEPAFARIRVRVPIKTYDPVTHMPSISWTGTAGAPSDMTLGDAIDYQTQLYGRGYGLSGQPRGGIQVEPDRQLASLVKKNILGELRKPIPGAANPNIGIESAQKYDDYSTDYGVTATMGDIYKPDVITPARLIDHNKIYLNAANPKQSQHLNTLVGRDQTNQFISDIAPGRGRIQFPEPAQLHLMGARVPIPRKPINVPPDFRPLPSFRVPLRGPMTAQAVNQYIQGGGDEGE